MMQTREMIAKLLTSAVLSLSLLASTLLIAAPHQSPNSSHALDQQIEATLNSLAIGNLSEARVLSRQMSRTFPRYKLAHLLSAELEATAAFQDVRAAGFSPMNQALIDLLLEAQARLQASRATHSDRHANPNSHDLPETVIQMGKDVGSLLIVDLEHSSINHVVGSDSAPTIVRQHYVGSGRGGYGKRVEGDGKTPLGIYTITGKRRDSSLPDLYGSGALTLDYPNALDRHLGRTGYGIWLHGVPHALRSRAPRSSQGCVTMSNDHMLSLMHQINPADTLVVLTSHLRYNTEDERKTKKTEFRALFSRFQDAQASEDGQELQAMYSDKRYKRRVRLSESLRSQLALVHPASISIFQNPALPDNGTESADRHLVMRGRYGSENEQQFSLYWEQTEDDNWRIVTEHWKGPAS